MSQKLIYKDLNGDRVNFDTYLEVLFRRIQRSHDWEVDFVDRFIQDGGTVCSAHIGLVPVLCTLLSRTSGEAFRKLANALRLLWEIGGHPTLEEILPPSSLNPSAQDSTIRLKEGIGSEFAAHSEFILEIGKAASNRNELPASLAFVADRLGRPILGSAEVLSIMQKSHRADEVLTWWDLFRERADLKIAQVSEGILGIESAPPVSAGQSVFLLLQACWCLDAGMALPVTIEPTIASHWKEASREVSGLVIVQRFSSRSRAALLSNVLRENAGGCETLVLVMNMLSSAFDTSVVIAGESHRGASSPIIVFETKGNYRPAKIDFGKCNRLQLACLQSISECELAFSNSTNLWRIWGLPENRPALLGELGKVTRS